MSSDHKNDFAVESPFDAFRSAVQLHEDVQRSIDKQIDRTTAGNLQKEMEALSDAVQSDVWIEHCRKKSAPAFPSGVTYLSQFLAHDMVETLDRSETFSGKVRNFVSTKLVLKTIYGDGPRGNRELFDGGEFNIPKYDPLEIPRFYAELSDRGSHPLLADQRNHDNPILMQIATAFMQFHNHKYQEYRDFLESRGLEASQRDQYIYARISNIITIHNIISSQIIPELCQNANHEILTAVIAASGMQAGIMKNAAFRGFHCIVRDKYKFQKRGPDEGSDDMLKPDVRGLTFSYDIPGEVGAWAHRWGVEWDIFFGDPKNIPNHAEFGPSFTFSERGKSISLFDFRSDVLASGLIPEKLKTSREKVGKFYEEICVVTGGRGNWPTLMKHSIAPLMLEYIIDGFYEKKKDVMPGKMGPIASEIFRYTIMSAVSEASSEIQEVADEAKLRLTPDPRMLPKSFTEMLDVLGKENINV